MAKRVNFVPHNTLWITTLLEKTYPVPPLSTIPSGTPGITVVPCYPFQCIVAPDACDRFCGDLR
ncbi:uncharacterized protein BO96DRAFT_438602 [Aspergillus niger CBS 101883]|uniref:Contig An18c0160, genomic contig n=2 Tax=Aspergillus niger TaxID=5061 RepID=A2RAZ8_ASPNC|nr:uncharacterized protein BO96DRAFT_438602 [Aspergillus niger CBS 101883]XP_059602961.1 uncharacterized protein An18g04930 [Aspergillus niger]PYH51748.1 hypothetical protein BO96DRAFT_438602 [Aspergillus niger CBS 101883]CAK43294.1 unnamed protein product [Aspergillus niger]